MPFDRFVDSLRDRGFRVTGQGSGKTGISTSEVRFERDGQRGYLLVIDLPIGDRDAARARPTQAIHLRAVRHAMLGEPAIAAADLLDRVLGHAPLGRLDVDTLAAALEQAGMGGAVGAPSPFRRAQGLDRIATALRIGNTYVEVTMFDYREAARERRVLVDGTRILVVSICSEVCWSEADLRRAGSPAESSAADVADAQALVQALADAATEAASVDPG
jgi:hypothetical protein